MALCDVMHTVTRNLMYHDSVFLYHSLLTFTVLGTVVQDDTNL